jgi:hypothetical protein
VSRAADEWSSLVHIGKKGLGSAGPTDIDLLWHLAEHWVGAGGHDPDAWRAEIVGAIGNATTDGNRVFSDRQAAWSEILDGLDLDDAFGTCKEHLEDPSQSC